jgi:hypothetical protein
MHRLRHIAIILGRLADYATTRFLLSTNQYAYECNPVARLIGLEALTVIGIISMTLLQLHLEGLTRETHSRTVRLITLAYTPIVQWLPAIHNALIIMGFEQGLLLDRVYDLISTLIHA